MALLKISRARGAMVMSVIGASGVLVWLAFPAVALGHDCFTNSEIVDCFLTTPPLILGLLGGALLAGALMGAMGGAPKRPPRKRERDEEDEEETGDGPPPPPPDDDRWTPPDLPSGPPPHDTPPPFDPDFYDDAIEEWEETGGPWPGPGPEPR